MSAKTEEKSLLLEVWDALSFSEIRRAMRVVLSHMFVKPVTFQYPREKRTIPDTHRGALGLLRYDDGAERCVGCDLCVAACPVNALAMTKMYEYATADKRQLIFDKKRLYEVGEKHIEDAKRYLYAHNQEKNDAESFQYSYKFTHQVAGLTPPQDS